MSSDEDEQFQVCDTDPRPPCRYGAKCYQKNRLHHSKYKHPPKSPTLEPKATKLITGVKRKNPTTDKRDKTESSQGKLQKTEEPCEREIQNLSSDSDNTAKDNSDLWDDWDDSKNLNSTPAASDKDTVAAQSSNNDTSCDLACNIVDDTWMDNNDEQDIIKSLFLVEMPRDFFLFYEFCKSISKDNVLMACKSARLKLVGPYDVLDGKMRDTVKEEEKENYLTHWRYYYDPPEFQTIIKCDDKEGLHFGYWRDDVAEKPAFVGKSRGNVNCIIERVAENIFGAIDAYLQDMVKSANPFEKTSVLRLQSQLKSFSKQYDVTLERNTTEMRSRERKVVARTFHKAGIVVPYDKKTQLGYRDLAATDNELQKILKQIEECTSAEERKTPMIKLDEIVRLATIAADECDFGTCLELGHDLFSNGSIHVQSRALQMLSVAYTHLRRPQLLRILEAHLKDRRKGCDLSAI